MNRTAARSLRTLLVLSLALAAAPAPAKGPSEEFRLDVVFVNATADTSNEALDASRLQTWVATAESMYGTKPRLKIGYTIRRQQTLGSTVLADLRFDGLAEFGRFMDDHFDNQARTETEGHLTVLVGETLCIGTQCWGGMAFFPHDVNPFSRKRGIWLGRSGSENKYLLTHELGHFFSLKHTFEPYLGLNKQCNQEFENKNLLNPALGHCNSCTGRTVVGTRSDGTEFYDCQGGVANVMDYCTAVDGVETLNTCQQERAATQRQQYLTKDGLVDYIQLAGLRGEGACSSDAECHEGEFCTAGVLDLSRNACQAKKAHGATCTDRRQCLTDRCAWGFCADADECQAASDCAGGQYCGDPISGKRTCKALKDHGAGCTKADQCASGRCSWGFCADADECRSDGDCGGGRYCGDPISGKRKCKDLLAKGKACTKGAQCASGKCSFLMCK